jgi:hypothetical protein
MNQDENIERSVRRAKREIRNYAMNNDFQWFTTFTMAKDRHNDKKTFENFHKWLKSETRRLGMFNYIVIPERHKSGAIHFHGLFGNYKGQVTKAINVKTGKLHKTGGRQTYEFPSYKLGWQLHTEIESPEKIATYITKYITKQLITTNANKKSYWNSRLLKKPNTEDNPEWLENAKGKATKQFINKYGYGFTFPADAATQPHSPLNANQTSIGL